MNIDHDLTDGLPDRHLTHPGERYARRLRLLADLWPSLDDDERRQLEVHLHRSRENASV